MSTRKVQRYLDAKQEYDTLVAQVAQYPELKDSPQHARARLEARATMLGLLRTLTGGELGAARRLATEKTDA